jgi:hypothetical protein
VVAKGNGSKADALAFIAALAQGRGVLSADNEGELILKLVIPETEAQRVWEAYPKLRDRSFYVVIDLGKEPAAV